MLLTKVLDQRGFPGDTGVKKPPASAGDSQEDPLEEEIATHSSILAWEIPRTEEPGGLQPTGSQKSEARLSVHAHLIRVSGSDISSRLHQG